MKAIYKLVIILIILYSYIYPVVADETVVADQTEWIDPQENTMRISESFIREGFLIEASDFFDNTALITVYDSKSNIVIRNITRKNDYFVVNDRLNITAIDLQEVRGNISASVGLNVTVDQWVKIETRVKGSPSLKLSIIPKAIEINNKKIVMWTYIPGSEIPINFSIKNEGKAKIKDMVLRIHTSLPVLYDEKLNYEILELGAGNESDVFTVRFQAPFTGENKSITISAEVKGFDIFGKVYQAVDTAFIEVKPQFDNKIELVKYVPEKVYMGDVAVVSIIITNNGSKKYDIVNLIENLPSGIEPIETNLSWNFALGAFEQKSISYKTKPQKPGTYYFLPGSSIIEYQGVLDYNKEPGKLIVNGPYVVLTKFANPDDAIKNENINVTIEAKNLGDAIAIVKISDAIPVNYTLSLKNQTYELITDTMVIHPGMSGYFSYSLLTSSPGSFILPPAKAVILDKILYKDERYIQRTNSSELIIKVRDQLKIETPSIKLTSIPIKTVIPVSIETDVASTTPKPASGFEGYIFIISFILILVIKKMKRGN